MARVIVLGAAGFIGCHVRQAFEADLLDDLWLVSRHVPQGDVGRWEKFDLHDHDEFVELMKRSRPEIVVNCAGRTEGSHEQLRRANVDLTLSVVQALAQNDVAARLVHIGSAAEYGAGAPGVPVVEGVATNPTSDYGRTKLLATQLVLSGPVEATVLRVFNPVGSGMGATSLIGHGIERLRSALAVGAPQIELGPLDAYRDFVHVDDVADAVVAASRASGAIGSVINVGSGHARQARELIHLLAEVAGFRGGIVERSLGSSRSSEVSWQQADVSRAAQKLGWLPRRDLRSGLESAWRAATARA